MSSNGGLLGIAKESHYKDVTHLSCIEVLCVNEKNPNAGYAPTLTAMPIQSTLDITDL